MKLKKPANVSKDKADAKANHEKISKFYREIATGEATTLPDLELDELKNTKLTNVSK